MLAPIGNAYREVYTWDFRTMTMGELLDAFRTRYIWDRDTIINDERQFYVDPTNATHNYNPFRLTAKHGLTITARARLNYENFTTQEYLSGVLSTHQKAGVLPAITDGRTQRISALLSLPVGSGVWPAWWLNPEFKMWPEGIDILPEIDIVEALGEAGRYYATVHTRNGGNVLNKDTYEHNCPEILLDEPHWYHVERDSQHLRFGFDDQWTKQVMLPSDLRGPLHCNLNLAVGGQWPEMVSGLPDLERYQMHCQQMVISEPVVPSSDGPNADVIRAVERMRDDSCRCITERAAQRIADLS